ncbi:universal stress protein [Streptomyces sp. NPDC005209]|uniref:universal stress protein n=1 Tax=Streptomyces sp. NPDC005209 TaxID=3156715 RepID=UPI0033AE0F91
MERVVLASAGPATDGRAAADWARLEARLRGLPLQVLTDGSPPDPDGAATVVLGVSRAEGRGMAGPDNNPATQPDDHTPTPPNNNRTTRPGGNAPSPLDGDAVGTCSCPLVLVPDDLAPAPRTGEVALGVDPRRPAPAVIRFAFDSARLRGVGLRAVHAWTLPPAAAELPFGVPEEDRAAWEDHEVQLLADALRPWRAKYPDVPVIEDVLLLTPVHALLHHGADTALVVVGRRYGSGAQDLARDLTRDLVRDLVREAMCPVAVVPS